MSKKADLIVWFDSKTGEAMPEEKQKEFINEVQNVAGKYNFDFYMSGSPESVNNMFKNLEKEGYFQDMENPCLTCSDGINDCKKCKDYKNCKYEINGCDFCKCEEKEDFEKWAEQQTKTK
ncbi:MAG: hypothetical protein NC311_11405 [Muribaculaceae bacterium]|nr:hypothetical protein [Muribaculaceae bacterium]